MDVRAIQTALSAAGYRVAVDGDMGPASYAALFGFVGRSGVTPLTTELGKAADTYFPVAALTTPLRIAHALAQWAVETGGFFKMEESLNYSAKRLMAVWPARFPTLAAATPFAGNPRALANKTYGGRLGNTGADDGWRYRGRGPTQLTGLANYREAAGITGVDVVSNPDAVAEPDTGLRVACAYWATRRINDAADRNDVEGVRRLVNGGTIGLDEAKRYLARAKIVLS